MLQFILHACLAFGALRDLHALLAVEALQMPEFVVHASLAFGALQFPVCGMFYFIRMLPMPSGLFATACVTCLSLLGMLLLPSGLPV